MSAAHILAFGANLAVNVTGLKKLGVLGSKVDGLNKKFIGMGVTTIFLDRLVQSLTRAWDGLNKVLGVARVAERAEDVLRLANASGVAADRLQAFAGAAAVTGAELKDVGDLIRTINERVDDLRSGTEKGISEDFARFGMSKNSFAGANNGLDQFLVLITKIDKLAPERRMAALEKLLGGGLAEKFGELGDVNAIVAGMQEAIATGQVLSAQQLKDGKRFAQAQRRLGRLMTALSNNIGSALLPVLAKAADVLSEITASAAQFFNGQAAHFGKKLVRAMQPFLDAVMALKSFIDTSIKDSGEFMARTGQGVLVIVVAIAAIVGSKLLGAAVLIGSVVFVLSQVIDDILTYMRGGRSLLGEWLASSVVLRVMWATWKTAFQEIGALMSNVYAQLQKLGSGPAGKLLLKTLGIAATIIGVGLGLGIAVFAKILSGAVTGAVALLNTFVEILGILGQILSFNIAQVTDSLGITSGKAANVGVGMQQRFNQAGGVVGSLINAVTGNGPTSTSLLLQGQASSSTTVNQTNHITATSSNPEMFASDALGRSGRSLANLAG